MTEIAGVHGPEYGDIGYNSDGDHVVFARADGPGGIVAYGPLPNTSSATLVGDKTIGCRVLVPASSYTKFFEAANLRLGMVPFGSGWKPTAYVVTPDGDATVQGDEIAFSSSTAVSLWATYEQSTGTLRLFTGDFGDTTEVNDTTFGEARDTQIGLPIWQAGAAPGGWVGRGGLWDSVIDFSVPPTVTINQASGQSDPVTDGSDVEFDVVFSEAVSDFVDADVSLSGTAGATTAVVTGSGTTYLVTVSGMTSPGTVIASIGAGVATGDTSGLTNQASTSTDNTVTWSLQYTDDFNRADSSTLGASWVEATGTALRINSNRMDNSTTAPSASVGRAFWNAALSDDHFVEWDISLLSGNGPSFYFGCNNGTSPSTGYEIYWESGASGTFFLRRGNPMGSLTAVTSQNTVGTISGKRLRIERENGDDIRIYVDGVLKVTWSDTTYPTGEYVGIRIDNNAARVDNFTCGSL